MTQAANVLNLTQGAISQKIKRLENHFSITLFERQQKTNKLTPDGERLIAFAYRLVSMNDELWHSMVEPDFVGEIRLGVSMDLVRPFTPAILRRFNRENPNVQLTVYSDMTPILLKQLSSGELDVAITTELQPAKAESNQLIRDKLVWIGAKAGEAALKCPLPIALGSQSSVFREVAINALNKQSTDWMVASDVGNLESTLATVEADIAVGPFLSRLVPSSLEIISNEVGLPELPAFYVNLHQSEASNTVITNELANAIREGFNGKI
jgi:DNA-binding transcriptional LysR family regulator